MSVSRDFRKLRVFQLADGLLLRVYKSSSVFPAGSATEARYLADVSRRLGYLTEGEGTELATKYTELSAQLQALINALSP